MTDFTYPSTSNVVVMANMRWGRGRTVKEARKNAGVNKSDHHAVFTFTNDDWDINDMGDLTMTGEPPIRVEFKNSEMMEVSTWTRFDHAGGTRYKRVVYMSDFKNEVRQPGWELKNEGDTLTEIVRETFEIPHKA